MDDLRFDCPYAARCGGCQLARLPYQAQLARKQKLVEELLRPFGRVEPILGMSDPFHYRNKVHAVFSADRRGQLIWGVYEAGTHRVVPVERCLIEDERASAIVQTVGELARSFRFAPYDEDCRTGFLRHVLVRTAHATGQLLVTLVTATPAFPSKNNFVKALLKACPDITTLVQNINDRSTSMVLGQRETVLFGKGSIEDELCGRRFRLSSKSFYQVNSAQTERLYQTAMELAGLTGRETLLDAYCGVGTIGLCASAHAARVIGVELNPQAVRDAQANARLNDVHNASFLCGDAGQYLRAMAARREKLDVVMMDPPRSGSDGAFLGALLTLRPRRIVYVSCDPRTLARDLRVLTDGGYRMERAVPVDMFPATEHVENVVLLSKLDAGKRIAADLNCRREQGNV